MLVEHKDVVDVNNIMPNENFQIVVNFPIEANQTIDLPCFVRFVGKPSVAYDIEIPNMSLSANQRIYLLQELGFEVPPYGILESIKDLEDLKDAHLYILSQKAYTTGKALSIS